ERDCPGAPKASGSSTATPTPTPPNPATNYTSTPAPCRKPSPTQSAGWPKPDTSPHARQGGSRSLLSQGHRFLTNRSSRHWPPQRTARSGGGRYGRGGYATTRRPPRRPDP